MDPIEEDMYDLIKVRFGNNPPRLRIRTMKEIENRQRDEMIIDELAALRSHACDFGNEVKWENEREREALHQYDFTTPFEWNKTPSYQPTQVDNPTQSETGTWESTYVSTYGTPSFHSSSAWYTPSSEMTPGFRFEPRYDDRSTQSHTGSTQSLTF